MKKPPVTQTKKSGTPQCPFRVTVELYCPVPGCLWNATEVRNGDLPSYRKTFALHWQTEHMGDWALLKDTDLSAEGLERIRVMRELDVLTTLANEGEEG